MVILESEPFDVITTYHIIKDNSTLQLLFGRDMIRPIKHVADCRYICQRKKVKIEKYVIYKDSNWTEYNNRVGYQIFLINKSSYKYKIPFIGL